jgi:hypothetical protein
MYVDDERVLTSEMRRERETNGSATIPATITTIFTEFSLKIY